MELTAIEDGPRIVEGQSGEPFMVAEERHDVISKCSRRVMLLERGSARD